MAQADSKLFIRKPIFYLSGSAILSFALTVVFMPGAFASGRVFLSGYLWAFSISITQWIGLDFLYQLIDKYISWIEAPVKKVVVQIFSFLAYSASAFTFVQLANYYIWMDCIPADSWSWILKSLPSTLLSRLLFR